MITYLCIYVNITVGNLIQSNQWGGEYKGRFIQNADLNKLEKIGHMWLDMRFEEILFVYIDLRFEENEKLDTLEKV